MPSASKCTSNTLCNMGIKCDLLTYVASYDPSYLPVDIGKTRFFATDFHVHEVVQHTIFMCARSLCQVPVLRVLSPRINLKIIGRTVEEILSEMSYALNEMHFTD